MAILVDTCILIPAFNPTASGFTLVRQALRQLDSTGETLVVTPQIVAEFWNVVTRPVEANGRGLTTDQARKMAGIIRRICRLEYETAVTFDRWCELVERHRVQGVAVHDARLAAVILTSGLRGILTHNDRDFIRYASDGVNVYTPHTIVAHSP